MLGLRLFREMVVRVAAHLLKGHALAKVPICYYGLLLMSHREIVATICLRYG